MENTIDRWDPPKNYANQIAAAITACARIYMFPYTSTEDCYYTDTDSVILGNPLPEAKGPAKEHVDAEWFESQHEQPERLLEVDVHSNFRVNSVAFDVYKFSGKYKLGIALNNKRFLLYKENIWIGSTPKQVFDLSCLDSVSKQIIRGYAT
ncbi:DNA polymerase [Bienertia sinuspersici]